MNKKVGKHLSMDRVLELYKVYTTILTTYEADGYDLLLFSHAFDLHHRLKIMLAKGQDKYLFRFTTTEAIAFVMLWETLPMPEHPYSANIVRDLIKSADKQQERQRMVNVLM